MIATNVGGIPEILEGSGTPMIPADDVTALTIAMRDRLAEAHKSATADRLRVLISERFTVDRMAEAVLAFYDEAPAPAPAFQASHSSAR